MKTRLLLTILLAFIGLSTFAQQSHPMAKSRPTDFEYLSAPDSTGKRTARKTVALSSARTETNQLHLPYPIIFIHGLNSNSDDWDTQANFMFSKYGLVNGGAFDFCLNYNGDYTNPNTNFAPAANANIAFFTGNWVAGDFYFVNFDVGNDGSYHPSYLLGLPYVESNQAAIVKQGVAVSNAIYQVLQLTGRDKVILMGHSMGGLAAREYLQNPNIWQADGQHHVAKLVTTGTPHGGSNAEANILVEIFTSIDQQSEACRDLRTSYDVSDSMGVYLFGGTESYSIMNNSNSYPYYNIDVNCDGNVGEIVTGLDWKDIYTDLDYSCIIGICKTCPLGAFPTGTSDGVVDTLSANLNNFYTNITTNVFYYEASAEIDIHTDLPSQVYQNMQGLDEPENYNLAYHIGFDTTYTGFMTVPAQTDPNSPYDFDEYQFSVPAAENISVTVVDNIYGVNFGVRIVNSSYQIVDSGYFGSIQKTIHFTTQLDADSYYLEIYGQPDNTSYNTPYYFTLSETPITTGFAPSVKLDDIQIYPNPSNGMFTITSSSPKNNLNIKVTNVLGEEVSQTQMLSKTMDIDLSKQANGVYFVQINSEQGNITKKLVLSK